MCTRFVYNGKDTIVGFNFEIDLDEWNHKIIKGKDMFAIGILMSDHQYHTFHGVNKNGNVGTLLYVNGNEKGKYSTEGHPITIADLTESFIHGKITLDDALYIVQNQRIVYAKDTTMQAMLSDKMGRTLIIEPGIGYCLQIQRYTLITNYSVLKPEMTKSFIVFGDDRFERTQEQLEQQNSDFSVGDAMNLLKSVKQEGLWATRLSFVYSVKENKVYYVKNNHFEKVMVHNF
ncbi:conjugal transfer protein [Candidatus Stoquefichus massiliensis]|uniref:conjugal transfer protein n=1 Tax=Candidatus Stoquefichus massiliensis TaxID=1470350 RepID=UPI000485AD87|nr:conjugal transfer protein [Candidatus Stoquefichus massiliensis]